MESRAFTHDRRATLRRTAFNSVVAASAAPLLAYLAGFSAPFAMVVITLAAAGLTWLLFLFRQLLGGASAMSLDKDGLTFTLRDRQTAFSWPGIALASFQSVNDTPWLVVSPRTGKRCMFCLESFDPASVQEIMDILHDRLAERFEIQETWILANRLPITVRKQPGSGG